jgi:hypothetical protein
MRCQIIIVFASKLEGRGKTSGTRRSEALRFCSFHKSLIPFFSGLVIAWVSNWENVRAVRLREFSPLCRTGGFAEISTVAPRRCLFPALPGTLSPANFHNRSTVERGREKFLQGTSNIQHSTPNIQWPPTRQLIGCSVLSVGCCKQLITRALWPGKGGRERHPFLRQATMVSCDVRKGFRLRSGRRWLRVSSGR